MNGSRLARGRMGRLAILAGVVIILVMAMFVYKTTSNEMSRLRDVHVKCAQQQEALAAQLQVIYEYKVQLEKTLMNEKNMNAAAKEELQQKASHERSLRDKDSLEAMQRFNALQQNYKLLQTELQDLKEEYKKKETEAQDNAKKLEEYKQSKKNEADEKEREVENLKSKNLELTQEKDRLDEKIAEMSKTASDNMQTIEHLEKQVIQLQREVDEAKKASHFSVGGLRTENSILQRPNNEALENNNNNNNNVDEKQAVQEKNPMQALLSPSSQQQVSSPRSALQADQNPQPLQAPRERQNFDDNNNNNDDDTNKNNNDDINANKIDEGPESDVRFENVNGNIVPVGPNDAREQQNVAPPPYDLKSFQVKSARIMNDSNYAPIPVKPDDQPKQVLAAPESKLDNINDNRVNMKLSSSSSSSTTKAPAPVLRPQAIDPEDEPEPVIGLNDFD